MDLDHGKKPGVLFILVNVLAQAIAWLLVAPVLDIVMYGEPSNLVFLQGVTAFIINAIASCVVGFILCFVYASTKTSKGSLDKE